VHHPPGTHYDPMLGEVNENIKHSCQSMTQLQMGIFMCDNASVIWSKVEGQKSQNKSKN
jgi:hypothetical protein